MITKKGKSIQMLLDTLNVMRASSGLSPIPSPDGLTKQQVVSMINAAEFGRFEDFTPLYELATPEEYGAARERIRALPGFMHLFVSMYRYNTTLIIESATEAQLRLQGKTSFAREANFNR